ncbi:hypothetical protein BJ742DRAFT_855979 [Cladochytrium replicatum]|nr:hypothetical protein BJ742DRAFT_855979 [Cladochytrium replicatum]
MTPVQSQLSAGNKSQQWSAMQSPLHRPIHSSQYQVSNFDHHTTGAGFMHFSPPVNDSVFNIPGPQPAAYPYGLPVTPISGMASASPITQGSSTLFATPHQRAPNNMSPSFRTPSLAGGATDHALLQLSVTSFGQTMTTGTEAKTSDDNQRMQSCPKYNNPPNNGGNVTEKQMFGTAELFSIIETTAFASLAPISDVEILLPQMSNEEPNVDPTDESGMEDWLSKLISGEDSDPNNEVVAKEVFSHISGLLREVDTSYLRFKSPVSELGGNGSATNGISCVADGRLSELVLEDIQAKNPCFLLVTPGPDVKGQPILSTASANLRGVNEPRMAASPGMVEGTLSTPCEKRKRVDLDGSVEQFSTTTVPEESNMQKDLTDQPTSAKRKRSTPATEKMVPTTPLHTTESPSLRKLEILSTTGYIKRVKPAARAVNEASAKLAHFVQELIHCDNTIDDGEESGTKFFSDVTSRMLSIDTLKKLNKLVGRVPNDSWHAVLDALVEDEDDQQASTWEVAFATLRRVVKLCEQPVQACVALDAGISKQKRRQEADDNNEVPDNEDHHSKAELQTRFDVAINRAVAGMEACELALGLIITTSQLTMRDKSDSTSAKVHTESMTLSCIDSAKCVLDRFILASIEIAASDEDTEDPTLQTKKDFLSSISTKKQLQHLSDLLCQVFGKLYIWLDAEKLTEDNVISVSYLALSTFFVEMPPLAETMGISKIQYRCMNLLRLIFCRHSNHRNFILDEILTSLIKLPTNKRNKKYYRLVDGRSIQMVTALILQLVQSVSSSKSLLSAARDVKMHLNSSEQDPGDVTIEREASRSGESSPQKLADSKAIETFVQACKSVADSAAGSAGYVLQYLLSKCTSDPSSKVNSRKRGQGATTELEYRAVLDQFLDDVLLVLNEPEWPAAEVICLIYSRVMIQYLEDSKRDNSSRGMALEWLGQICSKMRQPFKASRPQSTYLPPELSHINEPNSQSSPAQFEDIWMIQRTIAHWLDVGREEDCANDNARLFYLSEWVIKFATYMTAFAASSENDLQQPLRDILMNCCEWILVTPESRSSLESGTSFDLPTAATALDFRPTISRCAETLSRRQGALFASCDAFVSKILSSLSSDVVSLRTKALKALQEVVVVDPNREVFLRALHVRKVIGERMLDPSTTVRDAAIELIGKYVVNGGMELLEEYYGSLVERVLDVGTSVRKRIIKLLKDIYLTLLWSSSTNEILAEGSKVREKLGDIAWRILVRTTDDETTVKDLATKSIMELWFGTFRHISGLSATADSPINEQAKAAAPTEASWSQLSVVAQAEVRTRAILFAVANAKAKATPELLGDVLQRCVEIATKFQRSALIKVCGLLVQALVEEVFTLEDAGDSVSARSLVHDYISVLAHISRCLPGLFIHQLVFLQPYVQICQAAANATQEESRLVALDIKILVHSATIIRRLVPLLQNPHAKLFDELETDLVKVFSSAPLPAVTASVECLCTIALATNRFTRVVKSFKSCIDYVLRTEVAVSKGENVPTVAIVRTGRCLMIISLIGRYIDFDKIRNHLDQQNTSELGFVVDQLAMISPSFRESRAAKDIGPILKLLWSLGLFFSGEKSYKEIKPIALSSLGHLFVAYPRLLIEERSRHLMSAVFTGDSLQLKVDMIKVILEFLQRDQLLMRQTEGKAAQEVNGMKGGKSGSEENSNGRTIDLKVLIGNAEEMKDAAVTPALVNQYLGDILRCVLHPDAQLRQMAFEAMLLILDQSLVHPVECVPALVAMETCTDRKLRDRASQAHKKLADKHSSFIHMKNAESVRLSYQFQVQMRYAEPESTPILGYRFTSETMEDGTVTTYPDALLSYLHSLVQTKRMRRNELLLGLLKVLDADLPENGKHQSEVNVDFARFVAENLATFNYKSQEEVLFIIHHCLRILSVTGETCLQQIDALSGQDEATWVNAGQTAMCMSMLLLLKAHLRTLYGLSEQRCSSYVPSDSSSRSGEKPAVRASGVNVVISWEQLYFGATSEDGFRAQCIKFQELTMADGSAEGWELEDEQVLASPTEIAIATDEVQSGDYEETPRKSLKRKRSSVDGPTPIASCRKSSGDPASVKKKTPKGRRKTIG